MRHPTPREIQNAINDAIHDDMDNHSFDGPGAPMPARAFRLVREAISKACDEAEKAPVDAPRDVA